MDNKKPSLGDRVEIHLSKIIYEGVLLEVPESEKGIILLKLDSGYNIGFNKKDILQIKFLKREKQKQKEFEIKKDPSKPNVAMIITGGTIASRYDSRTGGVDALTKPEELFKYYPELFEKANVVKAEVPFMKSSEDMDFRDWQKIAKVAEKFLNDGNIKGVIITHGTDTLHYTSAALSFFLRNLNKPVVLTYSQRSIDRASSDANLNLRCAALAAISDIAEVMLVGHGTTNDDFCYAMPGTKVRKMHTSRRDAFKTINSKPFAKIFPDRIEIISGHKKRNSGKAKSDLKFEEKIALIKVYPGQDENILDYYLKNKYKGLILETTGLGHVPSKKAWLNKLKEIQEKGIIVCATAQTIYGRLDPLVYSNGRKILEAGVIFLEDMLSETALVKLGWVLGHGDWAKNRETVKEKMLTNFAHELNERLQE
ncbi:Glu-tRNA(Gln) amidotransferase subunit GatD [Candidatus Pacearchaeota archaeon]|nr:Glu-tRNA(Gln) amidotransferase subunit GatD [Candidatus Pacearchaeota archaeon]